MVLEVKKYKTEGKKAKSFWKLKENYCCNGQTHKTVKATEYCFVEKKH